MKIQKRYDFVLMFDVQDGNPNGDPDAGNLPRADPETGQGLVTDVCIKRKIRNYVTIASGDKPGFDIFIKEKAVLNLLIAGAHKRVAEATVAPAGDPATAEVNAKAKPKGKEKATGDKVELARSKMCELYFDVRTFGAVMSTGDNAGQVRGPVQLTFARSVDPIITLEHSITRMAVATEEEAKKQSGDNRTMGRKSTVPYGLYVAHGFISPALASQTGFSEDDLALFWKALENMFELDRSAARGLMSTRAVVVFEHASPLGSAPAHKLFERVTVKKKTVVARSFSDYEVLLDGGALHELRVVVPVADGWTAKQ